MTTSDREIFFKKLVGLLEEFDGTLLVDEAIYSLTTLAFQLAVQHAESQEEGVEILYDIVDSITGSDEEMDFSDDEDAEISIDE